MTMDLLTREYYCSVKYFMVYRGVNGSKIIQTIIRRESQFQSAIDIISKPFLISSDIKEACNIMKT